MENKCAASFSETLCRAMTECSISEGDCGGITVAATFEFPTDSEVFSGHFPGEPILPAVIQLTLVRLLAVRGIQRNLMPAGVGRIKFNRIVKPAESVRVTVKLQNRQAPWIAAFIIKYQAETVASGTIHFKEA